MLCVTILEGPLIGGHQAMLAWGHVEATGIYRAIWKLDEGSKQRKVMVSFRSMPID
jgi:hypothetical protein